MSTVKNAISTRFNAAGDQLRRFALDFALKQTWFWVGVSAKLENMAPPAVEDRREGRIEGRYDRHEGVAR